jgi:hypothetical protein
MTKYSYVNEPWWEHTERARIALSKGMERYIEGEAKRIAKSDPESAGRPAWLAHLPGGFASMYAMMLMHFMSHLDNDDLKQMMAMSFQGALQIGEMVIDHERTDNSRNVYVEKKWQAEDLPYLVEELLNWSERMNMTPGNLMSVVLITAAMGIASGSDSSDALERACQRANDDIKREALAAWDANRRRDTNERS